MTDMTEFGTPNFRRVGDAAIVLECATLGAAAQRRLWGLGSAARNWPHVREAVVGAGNLTLAFERDRVSYEALRDELARAWKDASDTAARGRTTEIPVHYDGEDLQTVADACEMRSDDVIALHAAGNYIVAFVGFLPGFAYLDGLDTRLHLPRRTQPRTRVPAGSVAIAGAQSGIYPFDSPGGWHIIGKTAVHMFDPGREPAALLQPGDAVRFVAV
ncbi:MAG TPA: 5-oxoprolinase subunit PxpB [Candidatus Acidoferrum sp.]|nr:5-oxoprolinase subunit PxpB [Candidatus Acidoferrum sp.]